MTLRFFLLASVLSLSACANIITETTDEISVNGRSYELRTRTIEGAGGTYETTDVIVRGVAYTCRKDSPGDCEAAVRRGRNQRSNSDR